MNNIGELKLYIRDEHVQLQTKKRHKKIFHSCAAAVLPPPLLPPTNLSLAPNPFNNDLDSSDEICDVMFRSHQASNDFESVANWFVDLANNDITETDQSEHPSLGPSLSTSFLTSLGSIGLISLVS